MAGVRHRQRPLPLHQLGQVFALDVFHCKDEQFAGPERMVGLDHVLMVEPGGDLDLAHEAIQHPGLASSSALFTTLRTTGRFISTFLAR